MCRKSTSRPPPHRNHQIEVVPVREVRYTRLAVRTILAERFKLGLIFMGTHDHHVPSDTHASWSRHDARNQFVELFVEFSGCLHQRRIVAYDH